MIIKINDEVILTTTSQEDKALEYRLSSPKFWIESAIKGQINHCKLEMIAQWTPVLMADPEVSSIPANENDLIDFIVARADYKTAAQRAVEEPAE